MKENSSTIPTFGNDKLSSGGYTVIYLVTLEDSAGFYYLKTFYPPLWTTAHDEGLTFSSDDNASKIAAALKCASVLCSAKQSEIRFSDPVALLRTSSEVPRRVDNHVGPSM